MCSYSCSKRVSLKVVLNLCHKIGFEVAKLPPQTRWRRPSSKLSLSPVGLSGLGKAGPRGPGARHLPCPGRPGRRPSPAGSGEGAVGASRLPPAVHTAACACACTYTCTCCSTYCSMYCRGGNLLVPAAPPDAIFF
jgi:hypothetical protein